MDLKNLNILISIIFNSDIRVITDLFKFRNLHFAAHFHCLDPGSLVLLQQYFVHNKIRIANIQSNNASVLISHNYHRIGLLLNTSCNNWNTVFETLNSQEPFKSPFTWIVFTDNIINTSNIISQYPVEVDSDVTVIYKTDQNYLLYEMYNTGFYTFGQFKAVAMGYWDTKLHVHRRARMDLRGVKLKCISVIIYRVANQSFEDFLEESKPRRPDGLHRIKYFTLMKYLRDMFNFTYILQRTNSWGYLHNESFDGLVGSLQRKEVDIGCSPVFVRSERAKVLDYAIQTWSSKQTFILRHPKHPGGFFTIYTRPLAVEVWYSMIAVLIIAAVVLSLQIKLKIQETDDVDVSPSLAVLCIWSAICQQGFELNRNATSIKLILFVAFLFALTLYQYYNATVVSTLLREPPKTIRTAQDLLDSGLKIGIEDLPYNRDFFKKTIDPVALEIYNKRVVTKRESNFLHAAQGMAKVKRGGYAFHVDQATGYGIMKEKFTENELCEAHEIPLYPAESMGAPIMKGSPYKQHVAYGIRRMYEAGLAVRIKSLWDEPKPECVRTPDTSLISVNIKEFSMPLIVLAIGMVLSVVILLCEMARFKKSRRGKVRFTT